MIVIIHVNLLLIFLPRLITVFIKKNFENTSRLQKHQNATFLNFDD